MCLIWDILNNQILQYVSFHNYRMRALHFNKFLKVRDNLITFDKKKNPVRLEPSGTYKAYNLESLQPRMPVFDT